MYTRILTAVLWLLCSLGAAQAQHTPIPMSETTFAEALTQLEEETERDRLATASVLVDKNYLTTDQVLALLATLDEKGHQESVAKLAYTKTTDQNNFYRVYEVFEFEDSRIKLRNWVKKQPRPEWWSSPYPEPLAGAAFVDALAAIDEATFDSEKMVIAEQLADNNYLLAEQVHVIIKAMDFKNSQDQFAKYAYSKTYDQQNYYRVLNALTFTSSKRSLSNWLKGQPVIDRSTPNQPTFGTWEDPYDDGDNINVAIRYSTVDRGDFNKFDTQAPDRDDTPATPLIVSDADFLNIRSQINRLPNDQDRLLRAKQISDQANWSSEQVRELMDLLVFENMRLDFAQYAYTRTMDVENYYLVHDALNSIDDQKALLTYIQSLGGSLDNASSTTNARPNSLYNHSDNTANNTSDVVNTEEPDPTIVGAAEFGEFVERLQTYSSDSDRLREAKLKINSAPLSSAQIAELLGFFIFDDVKLELAQYAYTRVRDPENYETVVTTLTKEEDQLALRTYMERP